MLVVENLSVRFRQHDGAHLAPIRDVSFTLPRGELTGLVGGSGAGKSLIAEALIGNLPHNAEITGRMEFDGARLKHGTLALAPQSRDALDPLSPVGRQVARFAKLAGRDCNVATLFSHLGLPPANLKLWPHELSGGMAKRVLLATALATGADCIIADEPTAGLDGEAADRIMALLGSLASDGKAVLVISHDLTRLAQIARQMVILKDGRQVDVTDTEAFHTGALTHPFTKALWQAQTWEDFALPPREGQYDAQR
ncbi:peptide/nickel transport system ATP-binding protein [Cohaesibacter sp. ES.047]|uniref:ATP-binding cassette domain-containing protein n=1 Tax=Cohaesibacter sp. ES.047 TaxID=1798205 RepID=UPI000BB868D1|nr:ATP-binding cassette domain-containing protein [Cohaesibacter sp. ES.047]SNY91996.1 peptide/nickel transport system ATP-binding protein [Cohaesibacter sp. ES.047]